jgi:hypothetical protein
MKYFCDFEMALPGERKDSLMGLVVVNPADPLEDARPDVDEYPDLNPLRLVNNLRDTPILFQDVEHVKNACKNDEVKAKFGDAFNAFASKSLEDNATHRMAIIKVYVMHQPKTRFKQLLQNTQYEEAVRELWSEQKGRHGRRLFLITALLTCQELVMETKNSKTMSTGFTATAPLSEAFTLPVNIDPTISASITRTSGGKVQGRIKNEIVLGAAYHEVLEFDASSVCFSPAWFSRKGAVQTRLGVDRKHQSKGKSGIYLVHDSAVEEGQVEDESFDLAEMSICNGETYFHEAVPEIDDKEPDGSIDRNQPFRRVFVISTEE